jgi:hypothetical protein
MASKVRVALATPTFDTPPPVPCQGLIDQPSRPKPMRARLPIWIAVMMAAIAAVVFQRTVARLTWIAVRRARLRRFAWGFIEGTLEIVPRSGAITDPTTRWRPR